MSFTRREFLVTVPAAGVALALRGPQSPGGLEGVSPLSRPAIESLFATPVISFHLDHPYLDLTGQQKPYIPPAGMRAGAPLAALTEEQLFSRYYGFI
jgi:hypothetical protein